MSAVVFDIGNVLVEWDPAAAFLPDLGCRKATNAFLERTAFHDRNHRADRGERFGALAQEIHDPDDRMLFSRYPERYALTVQRPIEGTWAIINRLKRKGHALHAITNWSAETWPIGLTLHPRLHDAFGVTIVSGREGLIKPDPAIFNLLCQRAGIRPMDCLFIDDSLTNVQGARDAGWQAHHFTTPDHLEADLMERGLL